MKLKVITIITVALFVSCNSSEKKKDISKVDTTAASETQQDPDLTESMKRGKVIYTDFCVSCHMPNGKGVPKAFPPLAKSDYLMNNRIESIKSIKYGQSGEITVNGITYNGTMTPLGLEDSEVADVMNYITNSWGNSNSNLITAKEVSEIEE